MHTYLALYIDWGRLHTESIHLVPISVIFCLPSNGTAVTVCFFSYLDPCLCPSVFQPLISHLVSRITSSSRTCSSMRTHQWVSVSRKHTHILLCLYTHWWIFLHMLSELSFHFSWFESMNAEWTMFHLIFSLFSCFCVQAKQKTHS